MRQFYCLTKIKSICIFSIRLTCTQCPHSVSIVLIFSVCLAAVFFQLQPSRIRPFLPYQESRLKMEWRLSLDILVIMALEAEKLKKTYSQPTPLMTDLSLSVDVCFVMRMHIKRSYCAQLLSVMGKAMQIAECKLLV